MCHYVLFLLAAHYIVGSVAQRNITVDDSDPTMFQYSNGWSLTAFSSLDYNGTHHLTNHDSAFATFTFTGTAVYFVSPLWPYAVSTQLQLDSQSPLSLNLTDPTPRPQDPSGSETVSFGVIWGSESLSNTVHTVRMSKVPDIDWAVVDAIIYTVQDPPPTTSSTQSTAGTETTTSSIVATTTSSTTQGVAASATNSTSPQKHVIAIAVGTVLGVLLLLFILAVAVWLLRRGKKRPISEDWTAAGSSPKRASSLPGPLSPQEIQFTHFRHPYGSSPNASWAGSAPQMTTTNMSMGTNTRPYEYHQISNQPMQDFDPYAALVPTLTTIQHPSTQQSSGHHTTTPPTIAERPTPGTLGSNETPSLASPTSLTDLSYYTPLQPTGNATNSSHMNDMPARVSVAAAYQHQHPVLSDGSAGQLWSPVSPDNINDTEPKPGKLGKERRSLVAVNRIEDEPEGSSPPAYTPN